MVAVVRVEFVGRRCSLEVGGVVSSRFALRVGESDRGCRSRSRFSDVVSGLDVGGLPRGVES